MQLVIPALTMAHQQHHDQYDDSESEPELVAPAQKRFRLSSSQIDNFLEDDNEIESPISRNRSVTPSLTPKAPSRKNVSQSARRALAASNHQSACPKGVRVSASHDTTPTRKCLQVRHSNIIGSNDDPRISEIEDADDTLRILQLPQDVTQALKDITTVLNTVVYRLDDMESTLQNRSSLSSSSESAGKLKKAKDSIPLIVRSEVRKTYKMLLENEENEFIGFDFDPSAPFNSPMNEAVVSTLTKEVIANNPQFQACSIEAAVYTYYRTKNQEQSLKQRRMYVERNLSRRRREKLLRKLQERTSLFEKAELAPKSKDKGKKVLKAEYISSEESSPETDDVFVKPIPWRSVLVSNFFEDLDQKNLEKKTSQANRQRKVRKISTIVSDRSVPLESPKWAVNKNRSTQ